MEIQAIKTLDAKWLKENHRVKVPEKVHNQHKEMAKEMVLEQMASSDLPEPPLKETVSTPVDHSQKSETA